MHKNSFTLFFAAIVTIVCSLLLAGAATLLRDRQQENVELDKRTNILASAGMTEINGKPLTRADVLRIYEEQIRSMVIDKNGNKTDKSIDELDPKEDGEYLPLYYCVNKDSIESYIIPISGKGLWSTIYGYLAIEPDGKTVKGITFYQHGETPGLGGEIEKEWFTNNFKGKQIVDEQGNLTSITVVKGSVKDKISDVSKRKYYVDGVSGATLTGRGLTKFLKEDLEKYEPFFKKIRK